MAMITSPVDRSMPNMLRAAERHRRSLVGQVRTRGGPRRPRTHRHHVPGRAGAPTRDVGGALPCPRRVAGAPARGRRSGRDSAVAALLFFFAFVALRVPWEVPDRAALAGPTVVLDRQGDELARFTSQVDRRIVDLDEIAPAAPRRGHRLRGRPLLRAHRGRPRVAAARRGHQRPHRRDLAGRVDADPAVREERLPHPGTHPDPQGPRGGDLDRPRTADEQGRDPRELPQRGLLRRVRLGHRGRRADLLRRPGVASSTPARARRWPSCCRPRRPATRVSTPTGARQRRDRVLDHDGRPRDDLPRHGAPPSRARTAGPGDPPERQLRRRRVGVHRVRASPAGRGLRRGGRC